MNGTDERRKGVFFICLFLSAATLAAYWPVLNSGFINLDDPNYVTANPHVTGGLTWNNIAWAFRTGHASNWHPLTWLSHQLDARFFGLEPRGHHVSSLALHILNTLLLFTLLHRMTKALWRSAFVAALFALHPLHVESVAWVAERKDVLSTLFFMLTLLAYAQYVKLRTEKEKGAVQRAQNAQHGLLRTIDHSPIMYYAAAMIFFAFGLMSKPMLVTVPFLLLLLDFWPLSRLHPGMIWSEPRESPNGPGVRVFWRLVWEKIPFFALSLASSITTLLVQAKGHAVSVGVPLELRLANAVGAYFKYLGQAIWPSNLSIFYPHPGLGLTNSNPWTWEVFAGALLLAGITGWALRRVKSEPWLATGWFWYLGTLVPVIGVVQVGSQAMADRYTYVPLIGIFIWVAWSAAQFLSDSRWGKGALWASGIAVVLACAAVANNQVRYWQSTTSVFEHALAINPSNAVALYNLGGEYARQGKFGLAALQLEAALKAAPSLVDAHVALGAVLDAQGKTDEALEQLYAALEQKPWHPAAQNYLGLMLLRQGKNDEAREHFEEALRMDPDLVPARGNLGNALASAGKLEEAMIQFQAALVCDPHDERAHFGLGSTLFRQGKREQAILEYETVLRLNPTNCNALNDLAWVRATAPDAGLRNGIEAVKLAEQACQVTEFQNPQLIGTLAAAYAEAGRFGEAIRSAEKARDLAKEAGRKPLAERNQELLECYQAGKPYHEPASPR